MNPPRPSRLALAVFDRFIPDDEPLRGDLLEEFELRRSQWWLWRQVLGAVICRRPRPRLQQTHTMTVLGAALLLLASFEAVFALNLVQRLILGPAMPDITGYFYLWQSGMTVPTGPRELPPVLWLPALLSVAASMPAGWMIGALHQQHKTLAVALFTVSIALCAVLNLGSPFASQLLTMLIFVMGLLVGGRLATASAAQGSS
jgi:hypothetical protein